MRRLLWVTLLILAVPFASAQLQDNGNGTVTDLSLGVTWTKNANMAGEKTWQEARDWVENVLNAQNFGGYDDWRLTTAGIAPGNFSSCQFCYLFMGHGITASNPGPFENVQKDYYWTATDVGGDPPRALVFHFGYGGHDIKPKSDAFPVWAVRGRMSTNIGMLRIHKVVRAGSGPSTPARFDLFIDNVRVAQGVGNDGHTGLLVLAPGSHAVSEQASAGTSGEDYIAAFEGDCDATGRVTVVAGEQKKCIITNTKAAWLKVEKVARPLTAMRVTLMVDGQVRARNVGHGGSVRVRLEPGRHWVSEMPDVAGGLPVPPEAGEPFRLFRAYRIAFSGACDENGVVFLNSGESKTCKIENHRRAGALTPSECKAACRQFEGVCTNGWAMSGFVNAEACRAQGERCLASCPPG